MTICGKRILLTGGAGFIGTALAKRLIKNNQVIVYDNNYRNSLNNRSLCDHENLQVINGDVLDMEGVRQVVQDCQIVVHLAAIAGVDTVMEMPVTTMQVSMVGTYNVLEALRHENKVECFIDFSTSEVFGTYAYKVGETDTTTLGVVGEARWTYAVSKLATEHMTHSYFKQYGLPGLSVRPFNIYGPGQVGEGAIHRFIIRALTGQPLDVHNDGDQIRAWCYIDDIVNGVVLCMGEPEGVGHAFNIGNPRSVCTVYDLACKVVRLCNSSSEIRFVEWNNPDVQLRIPDIDKARKILGFFPEVDIEEGLQRTIEWYRPRIDRE